MEHYHFGWLFFHFSFSLEVGLQDVDGGKQCFGIYFVFVELRSVPFNGLGDELKGEGAAFE